MKKLIALVASAILVGSVAIAQPVPVSSWNFNQSTTPSYSDLNVTTSPVTLFGVSNISLQPACVMNNNGYHGKDWSNTQTINLNQYYEFTVAPASNYTLNIVGISFGYIRSQHGPSSGEIRSSLDNFATSIGNFTYQFQNNAPCYNQIIDLGANTAFLGLSTPVTFRIYAYSAGSNQQARVLTIDDMVVNGVIVPGTALPVKITALNAAYSNNIVEVKWTTAVEKNNDHFIVEKSLNGKDFETIGLVKGAGQSTDLKSYTFFDSEIKSDKLFYRLKQVDLDGKYTYSSILPVHIKKGNYGTSAIAISGTNRIMVQHSTSFDETIEVSVIDLSGKMMESYNLPAVKGNNSYELSTGILPAGIYILSVKSLKGVTARKFIK